jgi:hypothetical protein
MVTRILHKEETADNTMSPTWRKLTEHKNAINRIKDKQPHVHFPFFCLPTGFFSGT